MRLLIGNDQTISVSGVQDAVSGDFINNAVITATVKDACGEQVSGQDWPLTLNYVTDSDGNYRGTFEDGLELVENEIYIVEVHLTVPGDLVAYWRQKVPAAYRTL